MAVRGLSEMFGFVIDMGKELKDYRTTTGQKLCKHLEGVHDFKPTKENKQKKIEEGKMIFREIMNPTTSFHFDQQTGEYMFNN